MFSSVRLHELLGLFAAHDGGSLTAQEFRERGGFPTLRGARRAASEMVKLQVLAPNGSRYQLSEHGWKLHREPNGNGAAEDAEPEPIDEPVDENEVTLADLVECDIPVPVPPGPGQWIRGADGMLWLEGVDGCWWHTPGDRPPRALGAHGYWFGLVDNGRRVVLLRTDRWGREIARDGSLVDAAPSPSLAQPMAQQWPAQALALQPAPQVPPSPQWFDEQAAPGSRLWWDGVRYTHRRDAFGRVAPL